MRNRKSDVRGQSMSQWSSVRVLLSERVNSSRRSTFVARRRDQFGLANERENLAPPACLAQMCPCIYLYIYENRSPNKSPGERSKVFGGVLVKNLHLFRCRSDPVRFPDKAHRETESRKDKRTSCLL